MKKTLSILFFCAANLLYAQQITNVRFEQVGETVAVRYDITNSEDWYLFEITLHLSTDSGKTYGNALRQVSGDAGRGVKGGYGKQITWRAVEEVKSLANSAVRFKVEALQYGTSPAPEGFVFIQGGTFQMGSNESDDERPVHSVTVSSFYMGKYEMTQKQWREVMGNNPSSFKNCDNCPVESVSWNNIQEFLKKLNAKTGKNYRLPTEAEWEYAARGGQNYKYAGNDNINDVAWYVSNSGSKTHPVGQKLPNSYGLYDMSGNVWEWCQDDWHVNYNNAPQNSLAWLSGGNQLYRVLRGGSWNDYPVNCRLKNRDKYAFAYRFNYNGFRLAL